MEPRIQYAKTADSVSIAYSIAGDGPPLVRAALPGITHVQRDWEMFTDVLPAHARKFRVLWYDSRGTGLSDRRALDFSLEAMQRDLDAVVAASGFERFALIGWNQWAPIALAYAAKHSDRTSHLIVVDGTANPGEWSQEPSARAAKHCWT